MVLFNRHNEVWYIVEDEPACPSSEELDWTLLFCFVLNIVSNSVRMYMEPAVAEHVFKSVPFKRAAYRSQILEM